MEPGHTSGVCYPRQQTAFGLTVCSDHSRPRRHFPATDEARTHFGRSPTSPTDDLGLTPRSDHFRQWWFSRNRWSPDAPRASAILTDGRPSGSPLAPVTFGNGGFPATDGARTHFGRTAPAGPPSAGHRSPLPAAAIAAAPGRFTYPSSTRRTSPVMTNDRVGPLVLCLSHQAECRRNGSAIRRPISCGSPRHPVSIFAAAS